MTYHMPIADAEELAQWFIGHMSMKQRDALMAERPLLYARMFPAVPASTIIARVRSELGAKATVPAGLAADAVRVRHGSSTGDLMGWADRDTALVRFAGNDMVVEVPVSELRTAHDLRPIQDEWKLQTKQSDPWIEPKPMRDEWI